MKDLSSALTVDSASDQDSPWKSAIEVFFQPCMQLLFPKVASQLDWWHEPVFMDKELQKLTSDSSDSRRHVDKLVRVYRPQWRVSLVIAAHRGTGRSGKGVYPAHVYLLLPTH